MKLATDTKQLTVNTDRLETLLKILPGMAYRCLSLDHWPMAFVSDGCLELCGYHRDELESQKVLWGDFTHPEVIDEVDRKVRAATSKGAPFEVEYRIESLTQREREVFHLVAEGLANKAIRIDLEISERTVEVHRSQVMKKLNAKTLAQLVRIRIESEKPPTGIPQYPCARKFPILFVH